MSAVLSQCESYRYWLGRPGIGVPLLWVMLNPSYADASIDDRTIRRIRGFSGTLPFAVINLYGYRATKPEDMWAAADPVGPDNDHYTDWCLRASPVVVCAWGANAKPDRVARFLELARRHDCVLLCLGLTKDGAPRHPLYILADTPFTEFKP